jgi:hypothetical protein
MHRNTKVPGNRLVVEVALRLIRLNHLSDIPTNQELDGLVNGAE